MFFFEIYRCIRERLFFRSISMRILLILILVRFNSIAMEEIPDFGENPGKLRMYLHIPHDLNGPVPLVVALHGCLQDAEELAQVSGWNALADRYGFVVMYPEQRSTNNVEKCFNWFMLKDIEGPDGELASIRSMMDFTAHRVKIDHNQVFVYGVSAGAAMANSLLANNPSEYEAGAILAGGPHRSAINAWQALKVMNNPPDLTPEEWWEKTPNARLMQHPGKIIILQGDKDYVVDPRNAQELVDQWSYTFGTGHEPLHVEEKFAANERVQRNLFSNTEGDTCIILYRIRDLGHQLPVDPGNGPKQGGEDGEFSKDIDFYSTWYIARDFGLIPHTE